MIYTAFMESKKDVFFGMEMIVDFTTEESRERLLAAAYKVLPPSHISYSRTGDEVTLQVRGSDFEEVQRAILNAFKQT